MFNSENDELKNISNVQIFFLVHVGMIQKFVANLLKKNEFLSLDL